MKRLPFQRTQSAQGPSLAHTGQHGVSGLPGGGWAFQGGGVERRSGGKRGFLTTLPCLYFETYHTCAKNPNERNGKQTVKGKRALMGKMGCDAAKFDPISPSPQQVTETLGKQSARNNPPHNPPHQLKQNPPQTPPPGETRRAWKLVRPPPLFLPDVSPEVTEVSLTTKTWGKKFVPTTKQ